MLRRPDRHRAGAHAGEHEAKALEFGRLGDLVADQKVRLIIAVGADTPVPLGSGIEVTCRLSDRDQVLCTEPMGVHLPAVSAAYNDARPVNHRTRYACWEPAMVAVEALMAQLQHEQVDLAAAMSPADMKQRHVRSDSISSSRDPAGKARRRAKAIPACR